jgi:SagB-type dehydrogenase family enzyme
MLLPHLFPALPESFEGVLEARRSVREFTEQPVRLAEVGQLLWAAQGTLNDGRRTAPSAGGVFPLAVTLIAGNVESLESGAFRYESTTHGLEPIVSGDLRPEIEAAAIGAQPWLGAAALIIVVGADLEGVAEHFADQPPVGERGHRYAHMQVGHAAQNAYLQATALGLGLVFVGGFSDDRIQALSPALLSQGYRPLGLLAVGHPPPMLESNARP